MREKNPWISACGLYMFRPCHSVCRITRSLCLSRSSCRLSAFLSLQVFVPTGKLYWKVYFHLAGCLADLPADSSCFRSFISLLLYLSRYGQNDAC